MPEQVETDVISRAPLSQPVVGWALAHPTLCIGNEASCSAVSATLGLVTARFGDVDDSGLVTVADVVLTVDVLKALPDSAWEYQCYVRKESPEPHIDSVGIADVVAHVDALKLMAYALNVPACP